MRLMLSSLIVVLIVVLILLSGCAKEAALPETLPEAVPEAPAEKIVPAIQEAAVTIDSLTCITSPPPPDSAYCPNCHYYKVDWNGTAQGPVGAGIQPSDNVGYPLRTTDCGVWTTNLNTNCLRKENQSSTTTFAGGLDYVEVPEGYEFILGMEIHGPGFDKIQVEKSVICS